METVEKHFKSIQERMRQKIENSPAAIEAKELASKTLELTKYRNERNLMLFPFCSTSKSKRLKPINYRSSDGKRWLDVSPSVQYGMAKIWDFDILRFALSKAGEIKKYIGYFPPSVEFSAYECLKAIGRNPKSGKNNVWFEEAITRLVSTSYMGNIFRDDTNLVSGFTLISCEYIKRKDGTVEDIKISFDERLIESVRNSRGLLAIGDEVIKEEAGIKKRLLELVKVSKGDDKEWSVKLSRLNEMCAHEGPVKEFKRLLKSYSLPWKITFSKTVGIEDKVTFSDSD